MGVLVGLRGCSPEEAFAELARVVNGSGIGIGRISGALVDLARGASGSSAEHAEAFSAWGTLIDGAKTRTVGAVG
ncbi:ANTAR domain-containing protein [Mycobacterium yunnanensis]|uniref:ANTAR domain-containing protein n=2 Tax=Mycobacterium yunnanensis TaxID=368477 RepID=A0A9X3BVQ9_9MYCO|nr:ANTAR domain-containing protein [Mycobacterium yunnanensis]MCV7423994.1 ANTAR domain-containing protein [Mycobacterium yunnanensis]